ncbi:hypothetical protein AGMMS4957_22450 [Bacteroidia bacterium]|nr:hypothetical protein AGMMS4957_22450 [Bacteroidia bacterium]
MNVMNKQFFYQNGNQKDGPFSSEQLKGKINKDTLIWYAEIEDWKPAQEIEELIPILQLSPPPISMNKIEKMDNQENENAPSNLKKIDRKQMKKSILVVSIMGIVYACASKTLIEKRSIYLLDLLVYWLCWLAVSFFLVFLFACLQKFFVKKKLLEAWMDTSITVSIIFFVLLLLGIIVSITK